MGASKGEGPVSLDIPMPGSEIMEAPERMAGQAMGMGQESGLEEQVNRSYGSGVGTKSSRSKYLATGSGQNFG